MENCISFSAYYSEIKPKIDKQLKLLLRENVERSLLDNSEILQYLKEPFIKSFEGGKYLRGLFVCLGYEMFKKEFHKDILLPSAAYEIFQTSILLKDDIIDNSDLRRGKPTLNKELGQMCDDYKKSESLTICLSDYGYGLVYKIILESNFNIEQKVLAIKNLIESINNTIMGQILDIELTERYHKFASDCENIILQMAKYKTSYYTISGPLTLGAILGGACEEDIKSVKLFGEFLGIAFQIHDDIIGIYGHEIGKPLDSDIKEKKITLLYDYAMKKCDVESRHTLDVLYGKKDINNDEIDAIKEIFKESGALEYACSIRDQFRQKAINVLDSFKIDSKMKVILMEATLYLTSREK